MSAPPLPDVIAEGDRNAQLTSYAGTLRHAGMDETEIYPSLEIVNRRCQPPLPERELRTIARSVGRYPAGMSMADHAARAQLLRINETYAVVQIGKDAMILQQRGRDFELLTEHAFRLLLRNQKIEVTSGSGERRTVPIAEAWLSSVDRLEYRSLVFQPGSRPVIDPILPETRPDFNLWRGWAITPSESGSCRRFLEYVRDVICSGNANHYEWLLDWLADLFQRPDRKVGLAVVLLGRQGVGKTFLGQVLQRLLGPYHVLAEKPEHVIGRFNGHLARCLLLQGDEAFFAGDKRSKAVLKHLITGTKLGIERKGVDRVEMPNFTRVLTTSNERWVYAAEVDERRVVMLRVSDAHRNDRVYFGRIARELDAGGLAKLLHVLLRRRIDERRLFDPPRTAALVEQALLSLEPEEQWARGVLEHGIWRGGYVDRAGNAHVRIGQQHEEYLATKPKHPLGEVAFGKFLRSAFPIAKGVKPRCDKRFLDARGRRRQSQRAVFQPLTACREAYSERGRAAPRKWNGLRTWQIEK